MDCGCAVRNERSYRFRRAARLTPSTGLFEGGSRRTSASPSAHARHETLESGSFTLSGLRSRTPKAPRTSVPQAEKLISLPQSTRLEFRCFLVRRRSAKKEAHDPRARNSLPSGNEFCEARQPAWRRFRQLCQFCQCLLKGGVFWEPHAPCGCCALPCSTGTGQLCQTLPPTEGGWRFRRFWRFILKGGVIFLTSQVVGGGRFRGFCWF
jgi:hypothetical protein